MILFFFFSGPQTRPIHRRCSRARVYVRINDSVYARSRSAHNARAAYVIILFLFIVYTSIRVLLYYTYMCCNARARFIIIFFIPPPPTFGRIRRRY